MVLFGELLPLHRTHSPSRPSARPNPDTQRRHPSFPLRVGGHAIGGRTNDLFLLDLSAWQWSQPAMAGTAPSPRQASAITICHGNLLFVHGGRNNFVLEDLHMLDFVVSLSNDMINRTAPDDRCC